MVNGSVYTKTLVDKGEKVARPEDPVKLCYNFTGWYTAGASEPFDYKTKIESSLTLNKCWIYR